MGDVTRRNITVNMKEKFPIAKAVQICNGFTLGTSLLLPQVVFQYRLNFHLTKTT